MPDTLSLIPLHVETYFNNKAEKNYTEEKLADATAFVYQKDSKNYLITNWHVLTGRNPETGQPTSKNCGIPNIIKIWFHSGKKGFSWMRHSLPIVNWENDKPCWIEHPKGSQMDVAALPLNDLIFKNYPLDPLMFNMKLDVIPSDAVSILGFPFGMTSTKIGQLPIWKTGHIASDVEENYEGKPLFLIDATARPGMSGSPVIARKKEFLSEDKRILITLQNSDRFLGVFSGGISKEYDTEIGMVWKPEVIDQILANQ